MSENSHSVAIGAFIIGALLIIISIAVFIVGSGLGSSKERVVMVFDGSIKGLSVGAPVALRGVQIGQVVDINLILEGDRDNLIMLVTADLDDKNVQRRGNSKDELTEELIARGMRAQLNTQSLLTGLLYVQLDFHPNSPVQLADLDSPYLQVPTIPTELQKLSRQLEEIDAAQVAIDLREIASGLKTIITGDKFQALPGQIESAALSLSQLSEELRASLANSGPKLDLVLDNTAATAATANEQLPRIANMVEQNLEVLAGSMQAFEKTLGEVNNLVREDSPTTYELNKALRELALAGRAMQLLAKTLEEQPEALLRGKSEDSL
ncbi:MCE family protein [Parahaliea sp. F7430]|uniref:MCE family protein n=1 Tax=Sediminihaliea albiluteola TaxID=2758564 RepID=A0A7W2YJY3_9GAMM|nr:MlaD family protein [Sediminihaliea albiluteola]MBA6412773.1 MCE family protein [Sediminihaliea albiluteola]